MARNPRKSAGNHGTVRPGIGRRFQPSAPFGVTAALRAVKHILPNLLPLLSPSERSPARFADFLGKVRFLMHGASFILCASKRQAVPVWSLSDGGTGDWRQRNQVLTAVCLELEAAIAIACEVDAERFPIRLSP